jgi:hypothetical protein
VKIHLLHHHAARTRSLVDSWFPVVPDGPVDRCVRGLTVETGDGVAGALRCCWFRRPTAGSSRGIGTYTLPGPSLFVPQTPQPWRNPRRSGAVPSLHRGGSMRATEAGAGCGGGAGRSTTPARWRGRRRWRRPRRELPRVRRWRGWTRRWRTPSSTRRRWRLSERRCVTPARLAGSREREREREGEKGVHWSCLRTAAQRPCPKRKRMGQMSVVYCVLTRGDTQRAGAGAKEAFVVQPEGEA